MREVPVEELKPYAVAEVPLFHESGEMLFRQGETLTPAVLEALRGAGIDALLSQESGENLSRFLFSARNREIPASALVAGQTLAFPIYDNDGSLLVRENTPISPSFKDQLAARETTRIFVRRPATELKLPQVERYRGLLGDRDPEREKFRSYDFSGARKTFLDNPDGELTLQSLELRMAGTSSVVAPTGTALRTMVRRDDVRAASAETKAGYLEVWREAIWFAKALFPDQKAPRQIRTEEIGVSARKVINALIDHKDLLFTLVYQKDPDAYLFRHLLNVTILSIHLGTALRYNPDQIYELAHGAFLHDIGMFSLPPELYQKGERLNEAEMTQIQKHTLLGIDLLQRARGIPVSAAFVAYQHHERIDGTGYPKSKRGQSVHSFSRIVMIADVFDAMISDRPYRTAQLPYSAMKAVLKMAVGTKLDPDMVNQFLDWVSLYPIGSWLMLEDGRVARVISAREGKPDRPVVSIVLDDRFEPVPSRNVIDLSTEGAPAILSAIDGASFDLPASEGF